MNIYYLRTTDYPTLLELGRRLGIVRFDYDEYSEPDEEGIVTGIGEPTVTATDGGYLDYIGVIERPTGENDSEGAPVTAPIADSEGVPYIHANLITPYDIRVLAEASEDEVIQGALAQIASFFVTDEMGEATAPSLPHRVFA